MLLRYTGPKQVKTVSYNDREFIFIPVKDGGAPVCDVDDVCTQKFLLHPDRKRLFEIVKDGEEGKPLSHTHDAAATISHSMGDNVASPTQPASSAKQAKKGRSSKKKE